MPVPPRVQVEADGAASVVCGLHRRRLQTAQTGARGAAHAVRTLLTRGLSILPPIGSGRPLALIAGPCVIESEEHVHFLAREIGNIVGPFSFKASFANA